MADHSRLTCPRFLRSSASALFCAVVLLLVYGMTMAPTLTWAHDGADGGDLVTAALRGRLPHPPGFPTYLLLARLFVRLPWGDPAWRLNLLSALSTVLAAILLCCISRRLRLVTCNPALTSSPVSLVTALALGLSPLLWSQALIAELYAPAALFSAALLFLALRPAPPWLRGILWGLGIGVHPTLLFLAPLVAEMITCYVPFWTPSPNPSPACGGGAGGGGDLPEHNRKAQGRQLQSENISAFIRVHPRSSAFSNLCLSLLFALLTAGILYGPVLLAWGAAPSPWADLSTSAGWWVYVSGRLYHGYLFALPLAAYPARLWAWLALLARQFTPFGAALAGWGWWTLRRARPALAWSTLAAFGGFSFYALTYNTADSFVYLTAALPLAALWLAAGLDQAARWLDARWRQGRWLLLALPLLQLLLGWGQMDISADRSAVSWAQEVLAAAPPNAVIVTATDAHTFALWYTHDGLGRRPDVVVVDRDLWAQEGYRRMICAALGATAADIDAAARQAGRPLMALDE